MKIVLSIAAGMVAGSYLTLLGIATLDDEGDISRAAGHSIAGKFTKTMDKVVFGNYYQTPQNRPSNYQRYTPR